MRNIKYIVIHSADFPNGKPLTAAVVDGWHKARGFKRNPADVAKFNPNLPHVGYHFFIRVDGTRETCRALSEVPAAVQGFNSVSVNICLAGRDKFTGPQWAELVGLVTELQKAFPGAQVKGHRDFSPDKDGDGIIEPSEWMKTCPGFDVAAWWAFKLPNAANVL